VDNEDARKDALNNADATTGTPKVQQSTDKAALKVNASSLVDAKLPEEVVPNTDKLANPIASLQSSNKAKPLEKPGNRPVRKMTKPKLAYTTDSVNNNAAAIPADAINNVKDNKRLWGHPLDHNPHIQAPVTSEADPTAAKKTTGSNATNTASSSSASSSSTNKIDLGNKQLPFVSKHSATNSHIPPEGFKIDARVYIDSNDKVSRLDMGTDMVLPYWECGVSGSTTAPLPLKHATFRHAFNTMSNLDTSTGGTDTTTSTTNRYPFLLVALSPLIIELNSGDSQGFPAGSVILLEDTLQPGYRLLPMSPHVEVQALFLALPQSYYQTGKHNLSIQSYLQEMYSKTATTPCANIVPSNDDWKTAYSNLDDISTMSDLSIRSSLPTQLRESLQRKLRNGRPIRRTILAVLGISLSTLLADFMGKVAPLWLAVGVGGTCLVAGGTYSVIEGGEFIFTEWQMYREQKKIQSSKLQQQSQNATQINSEDDGKNDDRATSRETEDDDEFYDDEDDEENDDLTDLTNQ
jgi:hypothetical protein